MNSARHVRKYIDSIFKERDDFANRLHVSDYRLGKHISLSFVPGARRKEWV